MIDIKRNVSLKALNTFGINAETRYLCHIRTQEDLYDLIASDIYQNEQHYILAGGSNILFTGDFKGLIIKVDLKGRDIFHEDDDTVTLNVAAGESWHQLVMYVVDQGWGGIENLSLIPGTVGAAPMQNIGAYGVEIKNVVDTVEAIDLSSGELRRFTNAECEFGYRESVFKTTLRKKFFISSVTLRLTKKNHQLNVEYGAIRDTLAANKVITPSIKNISDAVIAIRQSKLPDPNKIGNAGSFFKNPTISSVDFERLKFSHEDIPSYAIDNQHFKIPAGWLIEKCGWKGKRINDVGVHPLQALVLVNYGDGSGEEILKLSKKIQESVEEKFGIKLIPEVNIL